MLVQGAGVREAGTQQPLRPTWWSPVQRGGHRGFAAVCRGSPGATGTSGRCVWGHERRKTASHPQFSSGWKRRAVRRMQRGCGRAGGALGAPGQTSGSLSSTGVGSLSGSGLPSPWGAEPGPAVAPGHYRTARYPPSVPPAALTLMVKPFLLSSSRNFFLLISFSLPISWMLLTRTKSHFSSSCPRKTAGNEWGWQTKSSPCRHQPL